MTLGLTHEEMQKLFSEEFSSYFKSPSATVDATVEVRINELIGVRDEATRRALNQLAVTVTANRQALLAVIRENNARIEEQLRQRT